MLGKGGLNMQTEKKSAKGKNFRLGDQEKNKGEQMFGPHFGVCLDIAEHRNTKTQRNQDTFQAGTCSRYDRRCPNEKKYQRTEELGTSKGQRGRIASVVRAPSGPCWGHMSSRLVSGRFRDPRLPPVFAS